MEKWWLCISEGSSEGNGFEKEIDFSYIYYELWIKIYNGYGTVYFEDMNVVNWMMNEIILGCLIFEILGYEVVLCI